MSESERKVDQLSLLHETGAGTPMGKLLRSFWQPVGAVGEIAPGKARRCACSAKTSRFIAVSGKPYLIGGRCAHRCTVLHTGWVQGEEIRCMYHGWRYDGTGQCTEMPAEAPRLKPVGIAGYPVHEYGGLIFAYMGAEPAGVRSAAQAVLEDRNAP